MTTGALDQGLIEFLILLMSRSMDPIVFANSTMALATSSIFWSVVLFGLSADLAKDSADELLNGVLLLMLIRCIYYWSAIIVSKLAELAACCRFLLAF